MIGTGVAALSSGGGVWIAETFGVPVLGVTALGISGLAVTTLGAVATTLQFYRYLNEEDRHNEHND